MVSRMRGGGGQVIIRYGAKEFPAYGGIIGDIKLYIFQKEGLPVMKQTLTYQGTVLRNGNSFPVFIPPHI
jgi:hypothetical protein